MTKGMLISFFGKRPKAPAVPNGFFSSIYLIETFHFLPFSKSDKTDIKYLTLTTDTQNTALDIILNHYNIPILCKYDNLHNLINNMIVVHPEDRFTIYDIQKYMQITYDYQISNKHQ